MNPTPMYDLHRLGWHSFQQLCLAICREILGQTVEMFLDGNDGGRDGAFSGTWTPTGGEAIEGEFVIQCKHSVRQGQAVTLSALSDELDKIEKLVLAGRCDAYVLLTNMNLSAKQSQTIKEKIEDLGVKHVLLYGATWINRQIYENKNLRTSVPRIYGLGDLSQILDERAYAQARAMLASMREDLSKIVITKAYHSASEALNKHGFVLLVGEPAAGKTTIASMLAMASLDQWGASTLKLNTAANVVQHWNVADPSQLFWIDDAFGITQYEVSLAYDWNRVLPQLRTMLDQGIKVIMTSRDYIYSRARKDLKTSAFPLFKESEVVIDVRDLSQLERRQILYNHLKLGKQPKEFKKSIKPFLESVASNDAFIPETARRISDPIFTKKLRIDDFSIEEFVERQESFLGEVLDGLDNDSKSALGLLYMRNGSLASPIKLQKTEKDALTRLGSQLANCTTSLNALNGSLVQLVTENDQTFWRFRHPTIADAYATLLIQDPELLEIFLSGSDVEKLVSQITCGDVGLEQAVIVPKSLWTIVIRRLSNFTSSQVYKTNSWSKWGVKRMLLSFLSRRCTSGFLEQYIIHNPDFLASIVNPGLYLAYSPEIELIVRFFELKILPEEIRRKFVEVLFNYAIDGDDLYALSNEEVREVFTDLEFEALKSRVQSELIPRLDEVRYNFESNFRGSSQSSDDYMENYKETLTTLEKTFPAREVLAIIEKEREHVYDWIEANEVENESIPDRKIEHTDEDEIVSKRSIFDDVDE